MTYGLNDPGKEALIKDFFTEELSKPAGVDVGLYLNTTDEIGEGGNLSDITTEPTGNNYSRVTYNFGTSDFTSNDDGVDWAAVLANKGIDVSDSSQNVDSFFVVINFQSEDTGDSSANNHLLATGPLDKEYDLSNFSGTKTFSGAKMVMS